jgi:hypothetical protein
MAFSLNSAWGTDEITSYTPMNHDYSNLFYTDKKIKNEIQWPKHTLNTPTQKPKPPLPSNNSKIENFVDVYGNYPAITENMLIIMLLVILILMCASVYHTVKQTHETIKMLVSIIATK